MLTAAQIALGAAAVVAGLTGTWSPCGFSMIDTIGRTGYSGNRRTTLVCCATFALGAIAGGVATFGGLSLAGSVLGTGGRLLVAVAASIAALAALGEAQAVRIFPQVPRQVPEGWRRVMPLPLAAALYGVLLGLGFTTFVLTLANWALAAICLALGSAQTGIVVGVAFGVGRALPVIAIAPIAHTEAGTRVTQTMAERPIVLRGFRLAASLALAASALALGTADASGATASRRLYARGIDPTVVGRSFAWQKPGIGGYEREQGRSTRLPGSDPSLGGPFVAWHVGDMVTIVDRVTLVQRAQLTLPGADKLAVSRNWLVYRAPRPGGGDQLLARPLADPSRQRLLTSVRAPTQIGRPALDGDIAVFGVAGRRRSKIVQVNLRSGRRRTLRRSKFSQLLNPSVRNRKLLYVAISRCHQRLLLGRRTRRRRDRVLLSTAPAIRRDRGHDRGHTLQGRSPAYCGSTKRSRSMLWTTALSRHWAYVTKVRTGTNRAAIVRIRRRR